VSHQCFVEAVISAL
jgi:hypothetical protein